MSPSAPKDLQTPSPVGFGHILREAELFSCFARISITDLTPIQSDLQNENIPTHIRLVILGHGRSSIRPEAGTEPNLDYGCHPRVT